MEKSASWEIQPKKSESGISIGPTSKSGNSTRNECHIYKVPCHLRNWNGEAYTPQVISIGPIHHGNEKFRTMEKHKVRCFESLKQRTGKTLEDFERDIMQMENSIRQCYVETVELNSDNFVKMIKFDASFILEHFLKFSSEKRWPKEDPLLEKAWLLDMVFRDLLLLENQLPFFVIEMLFNLAFPNGSNNCSLIQLTFDFFKALNIYHRTPNSDSNGGINHFTDLLRTFQLPASSTPPPRHPKTTFLKYTATQLHEAGVKFKQLDLDFKKGELKQALPRSILDLDFKKGELKQALPSSILDLDFKKGELKMPTLTFEDNTEDIVRNIVALEQCNNIRSDTSFTDFYIILDQLINIAKDVDLLIKKGIIVNHLGDSEAVISVINKLNKGIIRRGMNADYFKHCENLNAFAEGCWNRNKAKLVRQYFNSPWKGTATIVAFIILVLTLLQTIFTIMK